MAQATFKFSDDEHPLEANLIVEYIDRTGSKMEKDFPFNCGKDLQTYMKDIFEENWKELLKIMRLRTALYTAQLEVLILEAKITKGRLDVYITDGYARGISFIDDEFMKDDNAQKIKEILEIANR
jgi:hypothetical protein